MCKWDAEHEQILRKWKAQCFVDMWLQNESAHMYNQLYNWLSYPIIVLTTFSSAALFGSNTLFSSMHVNLGVGCLTTVAALLTTIIRQIKPAELAQHHVLSAKRYQVLIRMIDLTVGQTAELRPEPQLFMAKVQSEMDMLLNSQLEVPKRVVARFERKYGNLDLLLFGESLSDLIASGAQVGATILRTDTPAAATIRQANERSEVDENHVLQTHAMSQRTLHTTPRQKTGTNLLNSEDRTESGV